MRALAIAAALIASMSVPAHADELPSPKQPEASVPTVPLDAVVVRTEDCGNTPNGGIITCSYDAGGNILYVSTRSSPGGPVARTVAASNKKYVAYNRVVYSPDGTFCVATSYYEEGAAPVDDVSTAPGNHGGTAFNNFYDLAPCPQQPAAPGQPAPLETAAMIAARYWEQVSLPTPGPWIAPGRAITGKLAYLETNGKVSRVYTNNTLVGPLEIQATGTYTIDWGDGTTTGPYSFEGTVWPEGKIVHEYMKVGSYNVVATEKWTARWTLGGESGTLRTLQTVGRLNNFPVEQIQAVIGK